MAPSGAGRALLARGGAWLEVQRRRGRVGGRSVEVAGDDCGFVCGSHDRS